MEFRGKGDEIRGANGLFNVERFNRDGVGLTACGKHGEEGVQGIAIG